ncbi:YgjV family protein [Vibrio parahaemolyticus]|nr:YgjV family protein [Vibrio parahaemolyticus]
MSIIEFIGHTASLFVCLSLLMSNVRLLRYLNMVGCICFVSYGVMISANPIIIVNGFCVLINIYHLIKLRESEAVVAK